MALLTPACKHIKEWLNSTDITTDACQSKYLQCSEDGTQVLKLTIPGYHRVQDPSTKELVGRPGWNHHCTTDGSQYLQQFTSMTSLGLEGLGLTWTAEILKSLRRNLTQLEELYIGDNGVSVPLSTDDYFCDLFKGRLKTASFHTNPTLTDAFRNRITGSLPACIFTSNLEHLSLDGNGITSLPDVFPPNAGIRSLRLASQGLSPEHAPNGSTHMLMGTIPKSLTNLQRLEFLAVQMNMLEGEVPQLPRTLQFLNMANNKFSGGFPAALSHLSNLRYLNLGNNPTFTADVAQLGLSNLNNLGTLILSNTSIYGDLGDDAAQWEALNKLEVIEMTSTKITGAIPAALARIPSLQAIMMSDNPGIGSLRQFASALPAQNQINVFMVNNCSITDLPEGLKNLAVFSSEQGYAGDLSEFASPAVVQNVHLNQFSKIFNVSCNNITTVTMPVPVPNFLFQDFPAAQTFISNKGYLGLQHAAPGHDMRENSMVCPSVTSSADMLGVSKALFASDRVYFKATYCLDMEGNSIPIVQQLERAAAQTGSTANSVGTGSPNPSGKKEMSKGDLAGVVLGSLVGAIILASALFLVVRHIVFARNSKGAFTKFENGDPGPQHLSLSEEYFKPAPLEVLSAKP